MAPSLFTKTMGFARLVPARGSENGSRFVGAQLGGFREFLEGSR